ncbi:MAG: hypothetical protein KGJ86_00755 [Chloroflexota bacterium]|nr:hypothetical protein [Chloroflexota bacterium]
MYPLEARLSVADPSVRARRDNHWLRRQLDHIWSTWFADVDRVNPVSIRFVRPWRTRLAVIYLTNNDSESFIGVNGLLSDQQVPYSICLVAIAHELVHYCHGFGSRHPQRYKHPHRGNVVARELARRGLARQLDFYEQWTTNRWFDLQDQLRVAHTVGIDSFGQEPRAKAAADIN